MSNNYRQLKVWQVGMEIAKATYHLAAELPDSEKFGLVSQIRRSAVSIPSNIAEGASRSSNKDFKRFLEISLGSCYELQTQLLLIQELGMGNEARLAECLQLTEDNQRMLFGFIKTITNEG
jgi:four helix bundle protein